MNLAILTLIAVTSSNPSMDRVHLYAERDFCPEGMRAAVYMYRDEVGVYVPGCYTVRDGKVLLLFVDGDSGSVKIDQLQWKSGHKPTGL